MGRRSNAKNDPSVREAARMMTRVLTRRLRELDRKRRETQQAIQLLIRMH